MNTHFSQFTRTLLCAFAILLLSPQTLWAQKSLIFETTENYQKIDVSKLTVSSLSDDGVITSNWIIEKEGSKRKEVYKYDKDFNILSWTVSHPAEDTLYNAVIEDNDLMISGTLKGKAVSKRINIAGLPLYANPKIGLMKAFRQGEDSVNFWAIRNDTLAKVKMVAENQGIDMILVDGKMVRAHKIFWKCKLVPEYFFNRTYWFRESDGFYIGQEGSNGKKRRLIQEINDD